VARYIVPVVVLFGLALGLVLFVLIPQPAPPAPLPEPVAVRPSEAATTGIQEGVPIQAVEAPRAPSEPTPDPRRVNEKLLREAVFAPFREVRGRYGIFVKDLATGQTVALNEHYPFQSASLYKLPVMYDVFKSRDLDIFALDEEMTIGADDAAMDLGSLPWPIGTRITIGTALERMVTLSDNSGAYMLAKKVGSSKINDDMLSLGLSHTHIRGDDLQTSAYDMARLLELIARGEALSAQTSAEMVHLMARQQVRNRIPVLIPPEATVANKTGNWDAAAHDVAIIYGPRSTFVIALLSDGITDFDALYLAMSTAARNVYDLVNDPSFGSSATPALPRNLVASYQTPVRLPGGSGSTAASSSPPRPAAPTTVAPTRAVVQPADKPRAAQPEAPSAPAVPRVSAPPAGPAVAPAPAPAAGPPKPAFRPSDGTGEKPPAPAEKPAVNPAAPPSIFTMPAPTRTP
jgi:beta-lactamase class A